MRKGIGKERDTHPFPTKTIDFDTNPSGKRTQRWYQNPQFLKGADAHPVPSLFLSTFFTCAIQKMLTNRKHCKNPKP